MRKTTIDLEQKSCEIKQAIADQGYFWEREKMDFSIFEQLSHELGTVKFWQDVKMDPTKPLRVTHHFKIDFHNDCELPGYLGWYCVEQDGENGANLLIDMEDIDMHLSKEELALLEKVNIVAPPEKIPQPMMRHYLEMRKIYYVPWALEEPKDMRVLNALRKFQQYLRQKEAHECLSIEMEPGEFLIIDDARMLHGRQALKEGSKRFLKRVWIIP